LEPRRDLSLIRFRIDGHLHTVYQVPPGVMNAMVARVKLLGRMDVVERRRPLDGRIKTRNPQGAEVEMRLSTLPTAFGEKMVMRIFDPVSAIKSIEALGFGNHDTKRWEELIARPNGIILVTGPTGSGKTTTLYSTLRKLATDEVNVCTIEDPIEMIQPHLNQTQVQTQIDLGFADGLRALMRQDPDIIMVGEIRDLETAEMAIQAALTGHLVFSTLHTNDSVAAVTRLTDLGVPNYLIAATLVGVLAQRLVRTLCPSCKQPDENVTAETVREFVKPWRLSGGVHAYKPVGCLECRNTGYRGRAGLYELLQMSPKIREGIQPVADTAVIRHHAVQQGLRPLRVAGAMKVAEGLTTLDEVLSATPPWD
jgi:general secretion pathway protein E